MQEPVAVIENLTQDALQRIDTATGGVEACLRGTGTIMCLLEEVGNKLTDVNSVRICTFGRHEWFLFADEKGDASS